MPTWKLIALMTGWVLASVAIAIVISIVLTEFLVLVGLIDWGSPEYAWAINGIALVAFVVLVSVPIVFRKRFVEAGVNPTDE
jgi:predicted anti-sigma-YlaC factor YlaD